MSARRDDIVGFRDGSPIRRHPESTSGASMTEHVFLVAVTIEGDAGRAAAEHALHSVLPDPGAAAYGGSSEGVDTHGRVESWWIAEDDRNDGSDNDPAVFVNPGMQREAHELLVANGLTGRHNKRHKEQA